MGQGRLPVEELMSHMDAHQNINLHTPHALHASPNHTHKGETRAPHDVASNVERSRRLEDPHERRLYDAEASGAGAAAPSAAAATSGAHAPSAASSSTTDAMRPARRLDSVLYMLRLDPAV